MSIKDALVTTRDVLGGISVPVILKEQITDRIIVAMNNISACIEVLSSAEKGEENANTDIQ